MKIIITESQYEKLSSSIKRRLGKMDLDRIDDIIKKNCFFFIDLIGNANEFARRVIDDSLQEFIYEYKFDEYIVYDREYDEEYYEDQENKVHNIFWKLKPFLEMEYKDKLSDYYKKHKK